MKNVSRYLLAAMAFTLFVGTPSAQTPTYPYDHIHLNVPDPAVASVWYEKNIPGGRRITEAPDRIMYGSTRLMFLRNATAKPSAGSAIDHIGFSFPNVDAKVEALRKAGVKIVSEASDIPGLWRQAVVEDPWGTKLVLVEDIDALGIHHVEIRVANPEESLRWYVRVFGGDRTKYKGVLDAVRYRDLSVFFLLAVKDDRAAPSAGHSIDHLGFGPIDLDKVVTALKADGVTFISNPNPRLNPPCSFAAEDAASAPGVRRLYCAQADQLAHRVVELEGPGGVRIELLQHLEAGGH
jgi:catechol 2,3-dioxygenase-like lactoylglutathione lyase family enzyme/biotin operon repressor